MDEVMRVEEAYSSYYDDLNGRIVSFWGTTRVVAMTPVPFDPALPKERKASLVGSTNVPYFDSRFCVSGS